MASAQPLAEAGAQRRFLTFRLDDRVFAVAAEEVAEVIRLPSLARVPQAPPALLGIANLRGLVLPVTSLRVLLGMPDATLPSSRAIILDRGAPLALVVDAVDTLVTIQADRVETRQAELGAEAGEQITGAFQIGETVAKILDLQPMLEAAFAQRKRLQKTAQRLTSKAAATEDERVEDAEMLVTFDVGGQEFALNLEDVQEIVSAPASATGVPRADAAVVGMIAFRDQLLPLLSLRGLLGFGQAVSSDHREKVVVAKVRGTLVGLIADRSRAILSAPVSMIDPVPPVLAARTGGEARIASIYRAEGGRRLVSVLATEQIFREDVMQRLGRNRTAATTTTSTGERGAVETELKFLIFRLGDDEFALPVESVEEVARTPEQITRVPKAPKFLEGVINLRGTVLPVVDQRARFEMPQLDDRTNSRLIVVRSADHRAGLIVDSVSAVLRCPPSAVEPSPNLTDESAKLIRNVINLEASDRIIIVLDPAELLTQAERKLLDAFVPEVELAQS